MGDVFYLFCDVLNHRRSIVNPCEKNFCLCLGVQVPYGRRSSLGDVLNTKEVDERGGIGTHCNASIDCCCHGNR